MLTASEMQAVSGEDARTKDHFVIVDAVGVCDSDKTESRPLERLPTVGLEKMLKQVALARYKEPDTFQVTDLLPLPDGWTWASLDQLVSLLRNGISAKPDAESGLPILRISAVRPLKVNIIDTRYLNVKATDYADFSLEEGDLLFTWGVWRCPAAVVGAHTPGQIDSRNPTTLKSAT